MAANDKPLPPNVERTIGSKALLAPAGNSPLKKTIFYDMIVRIVDIVKL